MSIVETVGKLRAQYLRGLIAENDYITELQLAVNNESMDVLNRYTVLIYCHNGDFTRKCEGVSMSEVRSYIECILCASPEDLCGTCSVKVQQLRSTGQLLQPKTFNEETVTVFLEA